MWIFKYLRADRTEIDMGPYGSEEKAEKHRKKMEEIGAITTPVFEVKADYSFYKSNPGDY